MNDLLKTEAVAAEWQEVDAVGYNSDPERAAHYVRVLIATGVVKEMRLTRQRIYVLVLPQNLEKVEDALLEQPWREYPWEKSMAENLQKLELLAADVRADLQRRGLR